MNPFETLLKEMQYEHPSSQYINIGKFTLDTTLLLTDDLSEIFYYFINDKEIIGDLVKYTDELPYSLKIDMMYYLGKNKKQFKRLKKIKPFKKFLDEFSKIIAEMNED